MASTTVVLGAQWGDVRAELKSIKTNEALQDKAVKIKKNAPTVVCKISDVLISRARALSVNTVEAIHKACALARFPSKGKGKLADIVAQSSQLCIRSQGGHNAGHTIEANGKKFDFHILPSGMVNENCVNLIGSGCVFHIPQFFLELEKLQKHGIDTKDRIYVSDRAHVILQLHLQLDGLEEVELGAKQMIGTTRKGIGPTYSTKMTRSGIRVADLFDLETLDSKVRRLADGFQKRFGDLLQYDVEEELVQLKELAPKLAPFVIDQVPLLKSAREQKAKILAEGANAVMLDVDAGTYPFVTSSNTGLGGVLTGVPTIDWRSIKEVIGVCKAYTTRVGSGPMPTEQLNDIGEKLQSIGKEVGVSTGRKRRCGWLDLVVVKYSHDVNVYTSLMLTKLDVLDDFDEIQIGVAYKYNGEELESFPAALNILAAIEVQYETLPGWKQPTTGAKTFADLPENAQKYVEFVEKHVGVPISHIGIGPGREHVIAR